ncbi:hypothetical protein GW17_00045813 [Ensete ventricosum]|nr:hypothetical protein GW17_00045813 [Ensete ventricosum]RZS16471.1 hypothetical protein BHM03_00048459 [Ensete ventricosum]
MVVLLTNPIYSAFSLGLVLVCISLFYIPSSSFFVVATQLLIYVGAVHVLNHICGSIHEWFRIFQWFMFMDHWRWCHFTCLYNYSFFTNYYYTRYVMIWNYLDYKIKPDYRIGPNK